MARILAIDYGKKRVGLAVTDPLQLIANALTTVPTTEIWTFLEQYVACESIARFVIGYPRNLDNKPAEAARYVTAFVKQLQKKFPQIPVSMEDERFTSKMAFQTMIDGGVKKMDRRNKAMVDKISAAIILQSYLERSKH